MKPKAQKRLIDKLPELKHELLSIAAFIQEHAYKDSSRKTNAMRDAHERLCLSASILDHVRGFPEAPAEGYRIALEKARQERDYWHRRAEGAEEEADELRMKLDDAQAKLLRETVRRGGVVSKGTHKRPQRGLEPIGGEQ